MDNKLYNVIGMINDHSDIDAELKSAIQGLTNIFQRKYVKNLYSAINESRDYARSNPTREVVLLKALKAYTTGQSRENIEGLIGTINFLNTVKNINSTLQEASATSVNALSREGDRSSLRPYGFAEILIALALLNKL